MRELASSQRILRWLVLHPQETFFTETQVEAEDEEASLQRVHLCSQIAIIDGRVLRSLGSSKLRIGTSCLSSILKGADFIEPDFVQTRYAALLSLVFRVISVSRTSFDWGVPVPFDGTPRNLRLV